MFIELIPVLNLPFRNTGLAIPTDSPKENPTAWDEFYAGHFKELGFPDPFQPFAPGTTLVKLSDISDSNLFKLIIDNTRFLNDYPLYEGDSLLGGYVLRIDGINKYFPEDDCVLSLIISWEHLLKRDDFFMGASQCYPPEVSFGDDDIKLDFTNAIDCGDDFAPAERILKFTRKDLAPALEAAKSELVIFSKRLQRINFEKKLNIKTINRMLIWGYMINSEYIPVIERLDILSEKLETIRKHVGAKMISGADAHHFENIPVDREEVELFEKHYQVTLPEIFREFLLRIGTGAGPNDGVPCLQDMAKYYDELSSASDGKRMSEDFYLSNKDANDLVWKKIRNQTESYYAHLKKMGGFLPIQKEGDAHYNYIVLNGSQTGKIWSLNMDGFQTLPIGVMKEFSFFDWYNNWLDECLLHLKTEI